MGSPTSAPPGRTIHTAQSIVGASAMHDLLAPKRSVLAWIQRNLRAIFIARCGGADAGAPKSPSLSGGQVYSNGLKVRQQGRSRGDVLTPAS